MSLSLVDFTFAKSSLWQQVMTVTTTCLRTNKFVATGDDCYHHLPAPQTSLWQQKSIVTVDH